MKLKILAIFLTILSFTNFNSALAEAPYFVDFKKILNESDAGKKAQDTLKKKLNDGITSIKNKEKKILDEE